MTSIAHQDPDDTRDILYDLATLQAMVADFSDFVCSDTVFWQLSDAGPFRQRFPKLTVAGLLLCQHKLTVLQGTLSSEKQSELQKVQAEISESFSHWCSNVERKALREIRGRLHSWEWYLSACNEDPYDCALEYSIEVYARVYIHFLLLLLRDINSADSVRSQACAADAELRAVFHPGEFIWDTNLSAAFPSDEYWFLYGHPGIP